MTIHGHKKLIVITKSQIICLMKTPFAWVSMEKYM